MKNNDWLELPIFLDSFYPESVINQARKIAGSEDEMKYLCETIASQMGISKGVFVNRFFPYEKIALIDFIQEDPDDRNRSDIYFLDDDFCIVNINHRDLMNKVHKFLIGKPLYRFPVPPPDTKIIFHPHDNEDQND